MGAACPLAFQAATRADRLDSVSVMRASLGARGSHDQEGMGAADTKSTEELSVRRHVTAGTLFDALEIAARAADAMSKG